MPSMLVFTKSDTLIADLAPIVGPGDWVLQTNPTDSAAWGGADAALFDLRDPVPEAHEIIQAIAAAAPLMPLIFLGDDVVVAQELGEGLRYYVAPEHLSDLEHVLISLLYAFPSDEVELEALAAGHTVPRVLIVDDSVQLASLLARALRAMERFDVRVVSTGYEAVSILPAFQPDVAIIDMVLPDMDGRDICAFIKNHADLKRTKVIGISGYMSHDRLSADHVPMHVFVEKPFRMKSILDQVLAFLA